MQRWSQNHPRTTLVAVLLLGCAGQGPQLQPPPRHIASAATVLPLPPIGRVHSGLLVDGDPVWIVRTEDDEVRVLGARVRLERDGSPSFELAAFDPDCACFRAPAPVIWNLEGEVAAYTEPNYEAVCTGCAIGIIRAFDGHSSFWMDRYDFERRGESIVVGARWAATQYAPSPREAAPLRGSELGLVSEVSSPNRECPESVMQTSLESALGRRVGQRVCFAGRVLVDDGIARVCTPDDVVDDRCPDDAPRVYNPSSDVLESGAWEPADTAGLIFPGGLAWPRRLTARRAGDGFAEISTEQCVASTRPIPGSRASDQRGLPAACLSPSHDESWVRTPLDAGSGIWVEAPVGCSERERPHIRMLRVRGRGSRRVSRGDSIPERCHEPSATDDCPEIPWETLQRSIFGAIGAHNSAHPTFSAHFSYGIGGCFNAVPSTDGRLALMITDWRYADEAIQLVSEALARWNVAETFWVSVEPALCVIPGAFGSLSGSVE
ncbi:MAG: hypothetical protein ACI9KE_002584 [Polyangiales bacterium]|jgi:hypothetical protein